MTKLSPAMVKGLREVVAGRSGAVRVVTLRALRDRFMVKLVAGAGVAYEITETGRGALAEIDRAARQAEIAARPVPAMIGEPSARTAPPMPVDHEDEDVIPARPGFNPDGSRVYESTPEIPQAWLDHLVTILDAAVRVEYVGDGWYVVQRDRVRYGIDPERLDAAASEAIRRGIAVRAGDRLALADSFRVERAAGRGIVEDAIVVYRPPLGGVRVGNHRWVVLRVTEGSAKVCSLSTGRMTWWPVERAELADRHAFQPFPGGACSGTVWDAEGDAQNCPHPAGHQIHTR